MSERGTATNEEEEQFLALSAHLIGQTMLPPDLAPEYLRRIRGLGAAATAGLAELLETFRAIISSGEEIDAAIRERIFGDARVRTMARRIIILWYLGELVDDSDKAVPGHEKHHFRGLMWEMIHAHPLGLSGGYFGYWKYPPEN